MRRHLIQLASAPFISSRLATFGWVQFLCATRGKQNSEFTKGGWELWSYYKPFVDKVHEIYRRCRKSHVLSNALFLLSVSRLIQKIFAIKSWSRRKTKQMQKFFGPQFLWEGRLRFFYGSLFGNSLPITWQSLVEFCLLISVCEAWQWSRIQNLRRLGKNAGRVLRHLWAKVHDILRRRSRPIVVVNELDWLSIMCFVPKIQTIKVALKLRSRPKKVVFGLLICRKKGYPRLRTCIFKLQLLPTMWPDML